jgi:hypothetical protein
MTTIRVGLGLFIIFLETKIQTLQKCMNYYSLNAHFYTIYFHIVGILLDKTKETDISLQSTLEPELFDKVTKLLHDQNVQVRIASAITLYTLKKANDEVTLIHIFGRPCMAVTKCCVMQHRFVQ